MMQRAHINITNNYIDSILPPSEPWQESLESYAKTYRMPIIDRPTRTVLSQLVTLHQPATILEIGTAIGYSALCMHHACPSATIVTLEKDETMIDVAKKNIAQYSKGNRIQILQGDAVDRLEELMEKKDPFDFVFIDAAKSQYETYMARVAPLLKKGSVVVADNVLFRGYVSGAEEVPRRYRTMIKRLKAFNKQMLQDPAYRSSLIPVGDGLIVSIKV